MDTTQQSIMVTGNAERREVVFIDTSLPDYQLLIDSIGSTKEIQLIDATQNGLMQMALWAETHSGYDAIHVLSHGSSGQLILGSTSISERDLGSYSSQLATIGSSLTENGDILLYGCNVAQGQSGVEFIGKLAQATGADIAASDDLTGSEMLGGDWVLEVVSGRVEASSVSDLNYQNVLATTVSFSGIQAAMGVTDGQWGSTNLPGMTLEFGFRDSSNHPTAAVYDGVIPGLSPNLTDKSSLFFRIASNQDATDFTISSFKVYNDSGSAQTLTIKGYESGIVFYGGTVSGAVVQTFSPTVATGWSTVDLTGFTNISSLVVDYTDNIKMYFNDFVFVLPDSVAPLFQSATTNATGTKVILTYNESLSATTAATSAFAVSVGGTNNPVTAVTVNGSTVELTITTAITTGQTVTVAYTDPTGGNDANAVQDSAGNDAATLNATSVTNNSTVTPPPDTVIVTTHLDSGADATASDYATDATDGGGLSLREALFHTSTGNKTIGFDAALSGQTITLGSNATVAAGTTFDMDTVGSLTISGSTITLNGTVTVTNDTNDSVLISSVIAGSGNLTKTGSGTVTLGGNNTFTGATSITGGTLTTSGQANLNNTSGLTLNGGTLKVNNDSAATISAPVVFGVTGGTILSSGMGVKTFTGSFTGTGNLTISGDFMAGRVVLSSLNNEAGFSGTTTVSNVGITIANDDNLGSGALIFDTGTLNVTAATNIDNAITTNAPGGLSVSAMSGLTELSGVISGAGGVSVMAGQVKLSGTNTYTGTTALGFGTELIVAGGSAIADTTDVSFSIGNGKLTLQANETVGSINRFTGVDSLSSSAVIDVGSSILTLASDNDSAFIGELKGSGSLVKNGSGTFTIASSDATATTGNYTGSTTINAGVLQLDGTLKGTLQIASGGKLAGGGTTTVAGDASGAVTVASGGTLSPGASGGTGTADLKTGNLAVASGATLAINIGGTTAGYGTNGSNGYDQIITTGTVNVTGATLNVTGTHTPVDGDVFTIVDNDGTADAVTGTFSGLAEGATVTVNGVAMTISYAGGDGNDITLTKGAGGDTTPPTFVSAATNTLGRWIYLTYDEGLDTSPSAFPAINAFTVTVGGQAATVTQLNVSGTTVQLRLADLVTHGQVVTVAYTDPTNGNDSNATQDTAGNDAATLNATSVTNNVPAPPDVSGPLFQSAATNTAGNKVILTYSETLDAVSKALGSAFTVTVGGQTVSVTDVTVNGSTVELTLASAVTNGQTVTVAYTDGADNDQYATQDAAGNDADSLTATSVTNTVPDSNSGGGNTTPPSISITTASSSFTKGGNAIALIADATISNPDNLAINKVEVAITSAVATDLLAFTDANGIVGQYNSDTGVLTLTGSATTAEWQAALQSITYSSSDANATNTPRDVVISLASGVLGVETLVNAASNGTPATAPVALNQDEPSIAKLANGGFVVVWYAPDAAGDGVYGQLFNANGAHIGSEFIVNTTQNKGSIGDSNDQDFPVVTGLTNGNFVVAWNSDEQDTTSGDYDREVVARIFDQTGQAVTAEFTVNTWKGDGSSNDNQWEPAITALSNGKFVIVWESDEQDGSTEDNIYGQVFNADGTKSGSEFIVNTTTYDEQDTPEITALSDGGFVVVWQSITTAGNYYQICGQRYNADGTRNGTEFVVVDTSQDALLVEAPFVIGLPAGGFVVGWTQGNTNVDSNVYFIRYADNGTPNAPIQVGANLPGAQSEVSFSYLNNGGYVAVFENTDGNGGGVFAQPYNSSNQPVGNVFQVNSTTQYDQDSPVVSPTTEGGFLVAWESKEQTSAGNSGNNDIYIQRFNSSVSVTTATVALSIAEADTTAPVFQSAATNTDGTKVILTYDEALNAVNKAGTGDFNVMVGGVARTVTTVTVSGSTVELTLASPITNGQTVTVAYTDGADNDQYATQDAAGNDAASLTATSVTNNVPAPSSGGGGSSGGGSTTPTESPTPAPTQPVTEAPTPAPTQPVTEAPTPAPTQPVTEAPTPAPTQPVTEAPTPAPTQPVTEAPTPAPTTKVETVDGVKVETTTEVKTTTDANGNTTTQVVEKVVINPITTERQEDNSTENSQQADIPLFWGEQSRNEWATTASLPVGVGLSTEGSRAPTASNDPLATLRQLIMETAPETDKSKGNMLNGGDGFMNFVKNNIDTLVINKVTVTAAEGTTQAPSTPIVINGVANVVQGFNAPPIEALVIDASSLPKNTQLHLKNIEFAVILGDGLTVRGGEGANTVFAGAGSQNIVLGADDDELHGGDGNDVIGSAGGADKLYGDGGNDTLFGGAGNDTLWGGEGTDTIQLQGKFSDYTITRPSTDYYIIADKVANRDDVDTVYEFELFQFSDMTLTKAELDAKLAVNPNDPFNKNTTALASFSWIWDALA